jgi:hypothetical protein
MVRLSAVLIRWQIAHLSRRSAGQDQPRHGPGGAESLPPCAPELNPQGHVWDELREKEFPNRVFADLGSVIRQLETGLQGRLNVPILTGQLRVS